jgi:outer membrane protein OmpA-like peptidoglycan-associated protein
MSVIAAALVVGACASTQKPGTLTQAEQLYATLDSTGAERRVEGDMIRAKATIDTAQTAVAQAQGQEYVNGMSAVALRTVQIAQQNDQRVQAQRAADSLHEARLTKQLALAHVQQQSLEAQNAVANARADSLRKAADAANAQLGKAMAQLQSLVTEITNLKETSRGLVISLSDILFDVGKASLKPGAEASVRKISAVLQQYPNHQISVEGYTDSQGSDTFNQKLSEDRANSVKQILIAGGVDPVLISSKGFGKAKPVASNDTPEGRQANRRVEIVVEGAGTLGDQVEKPAGVAGSTGAAAPTSPAPTSPAPTSPAPTSPAPTSPAPTSPAPTAPAPAAPAPTTSTTDSTPAPGPTVFKKDTTRTSAPATDTTHHP